MLAEDADALREWNVSRNKLAHMLHEERLKLYPWQSGQIGPGAKELLGIWIDDVRPLTPADLELLKQDGAIVEAADVLSEDESYAEDREVVDFSQGSDQSLADFSQSRQSWLENLLPKMIRSDVLDNLDELMPAWARAFGDARARQMRRTGVLRAALGHYASSAWQQLGNILGKLSGR